MLRTLHIYINFVQALGGINMEDCNLTKQLNTVLEENIRLKQENQSLRETLKTQKNWISIKEGILLPIFRNKYGVSRSNDYKFSYVLASIRDIIKTYLGIGRITEINESNYDSAKEMAVSIANAFCEHEWDYLKIYQEQQIELIKRGLGVD